MRIIKLIHYILSLLFTFTISLSSSAQNMLSMLDSIVAEPEPLIVSNAFKTVRLINGYTSDIAGKNDLVFSISHRFGKINTGLYNFFGLDNSTMRLGFEYGLGDRISLGIGRSNYEKLYDGFVKIKLLQQEKFPVTITWLSGTSIKTLKWVDSDENYPLTARFYYVHELFISRKFSDNFSAQLIPVLVHRNMVETNDEQNLVSAIGFGANYTVNHWLSFSGEYYYLLPGNTADNYVNSLAFGVALESGGGHIFQIHLSNSEGMTEKAFIPQTKGNWLKGDIGIGFNIIRIFHLKNNK